MPELGEIRRASDVGFTGRALFVYAACPDCGRKKWSPVRVGATRCWTCAARHREASRNPVTFDGYRPPVIGDTARASTINIAGKGIYLYDACPVCGTPRWVRKRNKGILCVSCAWKHQDRTGEKSGRWKGGFKDSRGYIYVTITADSPFFRMATLRDKRGNKGLVAQHRLVMAEYLGRELSPNEVVHHINGVKSDNRISNLKVFSKYKHHSAMVQQDLQKRLRDVEFRLTIIEAENAQLYKLLQEVRDSTPDSDWKIRCYNTLANLSNEQGEGIVHTLSNEGEMSDESV